MMSINGCPRQGPAGYTRRGTFIFHFAFCRRDFVFSLNYYGFLIYFTRSINIQIIPVSNNEKNWKDLQSKSEDILKKQKGRWDLKSGWRLMDRLRDCDSEWELLSQNGFLDLILIIGSFIAISQLIKEGFQNFWVDQKCRILPIRIRDRIKSTS